MSGPFLCSIFMDVVGPNGFFIFLLFFHGIIGVFGIYRMRVRQTVENPDSQFVAMPSTITSILITIQNKILLKNLKLLTLSFQLRLLYLPIHQLKKNKIVIIYHTDLKFGKIHPEVDCQKFFLKI